MKKKERPERPPERPIEISNLIDEHIERGELPLPFGGEYLNQGGGQLGLGLESIAPKDQKNNREEGVRILSFGILVFAIIFGAYVRTQSIGVRGQVIRVGSSHLRKEGIYVGRVLSVKQEEVTPNFRFNYSLMFERPDLVGDRLCWLVRFEQVERLGHYIEVWIDVSENLVVGGIQCR
jgi:hypothetical protein